MNNLLLVFSFTIVNRLWLLFAALALISLFNSIVFIQSALDKITDHSGNKAWMKEQFKDCFLRNSIGFLLPVITFLEMASGLLNIFGITWFYFQHDLRFLAAGFILSGITLLMLLFGQRVSKNYAGAVSLTGYFLIVILGILFTLIIAGY
ncbi:MAG TPA: DoxX family protein [Bacteroidia bacterium]|jgi:hypothetical protein|nr:DoxX family protein [Bacteroidia bacterium]